MRATRGPQGCRQEPDARSEIERGERNRRDVDRRPARRQTDEDPEDDQRGRDKVRDPEHEGGAAEHTRWPAYHGTRRNGSSRGRSRPAYSIRWSRAAQALAPGRGTCRTFSPRRPSLPGPTSRPRDRCVSSRAGVSRACRAESMVRRTGSIRLELPVDERLRLRAGRQVQRDRRGREDEPLHERGRPDERLAQRARPIPPARSAGRAAAARTSATLRRDVLDRPAAAGQLPQRERRRRERRRAEEDPREAHEVERRDRRRRPRPARCARRAAGRRAAAATCASRRAPPRAALPRRRSSTRRRARGRRGPS